MLPGGIPRMTTVGDEPSTCFRPRDLTLVTYNVKGLNTPEKRSRILRDMFLMRASIVMLQETHFREGAAPLLRDHKFPMSYFSNYVGGKSRGVAILFANDVPFVLRDSCTDDQGRYLFVKGTIAEVVYTFATIYIANVAQSACLARIMSKLRRFQEGIVIMAGDLNAALHPPIDTSSGTSALPPHVLHALRRSLHDMRLVDTWRAFHPGERDFTFYSNPHRVSSRLDYIFLEQYRLDLVMEATIHPTTWSDHAPVSIRLTSPLFRPRERTWRLNVSMLSDREITAGTRDVLTNYFEENLSAGVARPVTWEAHKAVIRGYFVSKGTALKKAREGQRLDLLAEIRALELSRNGDTDAETQTQLLLARRTLNDLLSLDLKQAAARTKCFFALNENRPGKLLARMLRKQRQLAYIPKIRTSAGDITLRPEEISAAFRDYYMSLYNLPDSNPPLPGR
uniref:exodeoxyribonuclease III n=1 Tax=Leptobrachium leishanense TaxID=445787 RepID=A0A8C5MJ29_9ANUR